jgi:hypothetical protein
LVEAGRAVPSRHRGDGGDQAGCFQRELKGQAAAGGQARGIDPRAVDVELAAKLGEDLAHVADVDPLSRVLREAALKVAALRQEV